MRVNLPTITAPVLLVDELNKALYSTAQGEGVYSEFNGGVDLRSSENAAADFKLRQEHIQPEQVIRVRFGGLWHTRDNMSDVSGYSATGLGDINVAAGQVMPGCSARVYVPFDGATLRWNISFFWYITKWLGLLQEQGDYVSQGARVVTMVFVDGNHVPSLDREYPMTWFKRAIADYTQVAGGTVVNDIPCTTEAEQASFMNLSYLQLAADQGFHEVSLGFYVKPLKTADGDPVTYERDTLRNGQMDASNLQRTLELYQRLSIGVSSARVVAFR
jgi:hypothetical protein